MLSLIIEIQSGLVRGAIVKKGNRKPEVLLQYTLPISTPSEKTSAHLTKAMLKAVADVAKHLTHKHFVESVNVVLSSPWALSHSKAVEMNFDKNTTVDSRMVLDLVDEDNSSKRSHPDLIYIEKKIFEVKLNGYVVTNYENKPAKKLEISYATTLGSKELLEKIYKALEQAFKVKKIEYHSGLLLDFIALGTLFPDRNDYVYIHAHSELTDVVIVKSSTCAHISSFPTGTTQLAQKVPESLLNLIDKETISKAEEQRLSPKLNSFFGEWFAQIHSLADMKNAPRFIYISTHSHLNIFKKNLQESMGKEYHIHTFAPNTIEMYSIALRDML